MKSEVRFELNDGMYVEEHCLISKRLSFAQRGRLDTKVRRKPLQDGPSHAARFMLPTDAYDGLMAGLSIGRVTIDPLVKLSKLGLGPPGDFAR